MTFVTAAAFLNQLADPAKARPLSAGTTPGDRVPPEGVAVMQEEGIDLSGARPQKLTREEDGARRWLVRAGPVRPISGARANLRG